MKKKRIYFEELSFYFELQIHNIFSTRRTETIFMFNEYLWSKEQLLTVQVIYILKEYRSLNLFNQAMDIIKNQAKGRHIHLTISTKLLADKLLDRYGFEKMGGLWRYSDV